MRRSLIFAFCSRMRAIFSARASSDNFSLYLGNISATKESRDIGGKTHPLRTSSPESVWIDIGLLFFSDCLRGWRYRRSWCSTRIICLWARLRELQPQSVGGIVRHGGRMGPSLVEPDRRLAIKLPKKEQAIQILHLATCYILSDVALQENFYHRRRAQGQTRPYPC